VLVDWPSGNSDHACRALIAERQSPLVAALHLAMVHGAVYDAVNAIDRRHQPYLVLPDANPWDSVDAAAATAAYRVLISIVPAQQPLLEPLYTASLAAVEDGPAKIGGIAAGEAAAVAMIGARANDGRFGPFRFTADTAIGAWRPELPVFLSDPFAWVARVRPFLVPTTSDFRTDGPNALTSEEYAEDFAEVKAVGARNGTIRTVEQTEQAWFWADHSAALWGRILRGLATSQRLSTADSARMFAMVYLAGADATIACWDDKAYWSFWRPITAIRHGDDDGNPATSEDPDWLPLLNTPPFPEHPSGHGCGSAATVQALQDFFGTDRIAFSAFSNGSGTWRSYERISDTIKEVIDARVYSGIHFRTADVQGAVLGKKVARWVGKHALRPIG
jgi:hypothetical protein